MTRGPKRKLPTRTELEALPPFVQKLHLFIGGDPIIGVAARLGVRPQTLRAWLGGKAEPRRGSVMLLAAASGKPSEWWTDDRIVPSRFYERRGGQPGMAVAERAGQAGEVGRLVVRGSYAAPFAPDGAVVEYDVLRRGQVRNGDYVVADVEGEQMVKRIDTHGDTRVYISIHPGHPTLYVPIRKVGSEYPITAVIVKPRPRSRE